MTRRKRLRPSLAFIAVISTIFVVVAVPTLYIQPFKPQTGRGIAIASRLREATPIVTLLAPIPQ